GGSPKLLGSASPPPWYPMCTGASTSTRRAPVSARFPWPRSVTRCERQTTSPANRQHGGDPRCAPCRPVRDTVSSPAHPRLSPLPDAKQSESTVTTTERDSALRGVLATVAPGTGMRDGLERILRGNTGALIVMGWDRAVEAMCTGGFPLDVEFSAPGLRELC